MKIDQDLLKAGIRFHGHKCPAMPLGMRAGLAALKKLGVERASNKELYCYCETGPSHAQACFADGIQVATGCTFGKGNIEKLNYGKNAFTLVDVKNKRAVRVCLNPDFQAKSLSSEFVNQRKKGVEPKDIGPEVVDPAVAKVTTVGDDEILKIGEVADFGFKPVKGTYEWERCAMCGEIVFSTGLRVANGKHYCIPCSKL
ncbi:MAG: formylmethanofuran dehydrogenase [Thaumarchaeota archaeon]|nr:formylmethanofuran dehydrogenase [Nitrososphaerota archaeon]